MPLEIRELIIRTTVSGGNGGSSEAGSGSTLDENQLTEIASRVMEIIKEKSER